MNEATTATAPAERADDVATSAAPEIRDLCDGKRVTLKEAEAAVAALGEGWRLETPHEAFSDIDYSAKNAHGAISRDENRTPDPYWTCQPYPLYPAARVVVWFDDGNVNNNNDNNRARARAVRVVGQSSVL